MSHARLVEAYGLLEVPTNADETTLKKAYRSLVLKYHPENNPKEAEKAQEKIRAITVAYELLRNRTRCAAFESQANAVKIVRARGVHWGIDRVDRSRLKDVQLPEFFLISPMGLPDRFLRTRDQSFYFPSREELPDASFDEFFARTKFVMSWMPDVNNPEKLPKFGCPCMIMAGMRQSDMHLVMRQQSVQLDQTPGSLSFGLSEGVKTSDVMITKVGTETSPLCTFLLLSASPDYPGAYRFESAYFPGHFLAFDPPNRVIVTGEMDPFSIIDFNVVDHMTTHALMTVEEILIPTVRTLGGDRAPVRLTQVCQMPQVVAYFRATMGTRAWDFQDFETYFHVNHEIWDYNPKTQLLRLRSEQERHVVRGETLGALKRKAEEAEAEDRKKQAKREIAGRPTRVVLLCNLVGAGEVDDDLEEETSDEARNYGDLKSCKIKELTGVPDEEAVRIFLEYGSKKDAKKAAVDMNGRFFAGRIVSAHYYDEERFKAGHLEDKLKPPETST